MTDIQILRFKVLKICLFEPELHELTRDWLWDYYFGADPAHDSHDPEKLKKVLNTLCFHVPTAARWCHDR